MKNIRRHLFPAISEDKRKQLVSDSAEKIIALCDPLKIILFGSGATKKFDSCSDLSSRGWNRNLF